MWRSGCFTGSTPDWAVCGEVAGVVWGRTGAWPGAGLPCESVSGQALLWCLGYFVKHQEIMDRAFDF